VVFKNAPAGSEPAIFEIVGNADGGALTAKADGADIVSGDLVECGSAIVFTATPAAGFKVKEWKVNGNPVDGSPVGSEGVQTFTIDDFVGDAFVTVEFEAAVLIKASVAEAAKTLDSAGGDVYMDYEIKLEKAKSANIVVVQFAVNKNVLDYQSAVVTANGVFAISQNWGITEAFNGSTDDVNWVIDGDLAIGTVKLMINGYKGEVDTDAEIPLLSLKFKALAVGDATLALLDKDAALELDKRLVRVVGMKDERVEFLDYLLVNGAAAGILELYSYDYNKDGYVNDIDLAIMARAFGRIENTRDWALRIALNRLGGDITALIIDTPKDPAKPYIGAGDGEIDINDLTNVLLNFT